MITRSAVVTRRDDLVTAPVGEDLVMMDIDSGTFFTLDDIGTFVWSRLAGPTSVADLLDEIQHNYDVTPEQCEGDVLALLQQMHDRGLIDVGA